MNKPERSELVQKFMRGGNCAQGVLNSFADDIGYDLDETEKIAACFGGGMFMGETCGAVTGALMVIGMMTDSNEEANEKAVEFEKRFRAKYGSTMCRELLKYDVSIPEEFLKARESGRLLDFCPSPVLDAIDILEEII